MPTPSEPGTHTSSSLTSVVQDTSKSKGGKVFWNSLRALSYRFLLQKLRSPVAMIFELLLPVVLIVLFGLATMSGSPFQTAVVESYRFSDPAYDGCPAGMYGASLQPDFPSTSGSVASRVGPYAEKLMSDANLTMGELLCSGVLSSPTLQRSNPLSALAVLLAFPFVPPYHGVIDVNTPLFVIKDKSGKVIPHLDHPFAQFMNQVSEAVFGTDPVLSDEVYGPVPRPTAASYIHFDAKASYSFHLYFNDFGSGDAPMDVEVFGPFGSTQLSGSDQIRSGFFIPFYSFTSFPNNLDPFGQSENPVSHQAVHRLLLAYARWLEAGKVLSPGQAMHKKEAWVFILRNRQMSKRLNQDRFIEGLMLGEKMKQLETICIIVVQANRSHFSEAKDTSLRLGVNQYFKLFRTDPVVDMWTEITDHTETETACGRNHRWQNLVNLMFDSSNFKDIPADSALGPAAVGGLTFSGAGVAKQYAEDQLLLRLVTLWDRATISKFLPSIIPEVQGFTEHAFPNREGYYSLFGEFFSSNPSGNFFFLAGLCVVVDRIARTVMLDKELKIFSFLSVFGASRAQYFASVYAFFGIYYVFLCLAMTGATFYPYQSPDFFVVCFGLWLAVLQLTSWTIFVCSFFRQPSLAAYTSIFTILFGGSIQLFVDQVNSRSLDIFICILPQNAILRANSLYLAFQMWTVGSPHGISIRDVANEFEGVALIYVWCMSVVGAVVWFLLGSYVALVFPKDDTTRRPWHFPVTMWFSPPAEGEVDSSPTETVTPAYFQPDTSMNEVFARLQNVRKSFPRKGGAKEVVRGVSLTLKQNEIFVLLGHNGAGKTTTIRMIIGELGLSAGEISIDGHSMVTDRSRARGSLGYCPQHGVLFPFMTVKEHFNMIGLLKGVDKRTRRQQIDEALDTLGLTSKVDSRTSALSGGQQRRVSVGMALMGNSRVILLDEPTTGMDPHTRRGFWKAVERVRDSGRAVLLTTHFMDEADQLADKVGIMHSGLIRCEGSPVFLKRLLHVAYNISVTLTDSSSSTLTRATRGLEAASSEIRRTRQNAKEATFSLKTSDDLSAVIGALEDGSVEGVSSFSLSGPSLEAVFLRVAAHPDDLNADADPTPRPNTLEEDVFTKYAEIAKLTPHSRRMQQMFTGLYWRRYKLYSRSLSSVIMQVLLPCLLVVVVGAALKVIDLGLGPQLVSGGHLNLNTPYPLKPMVTIPVSSDFPCLSNPPPGYTFIDSGVTSMVQMDDYLLSEFKFQRGEIMPAFAFTKDGLWYNDNQYGRAFAHALSSWEMCHLNIRKDIRIAQTMRTTALFERIIDTIMDTNASVYTVIAVSIAPAYWSYLLGSERVNGQRRMLAMAGASPSIFWLAEFMVDYTSYLLSVVFVLFTVWMFGMALLRNGECFAATAVSILVFPCAMGPLSFIFSLLFNKPLAGFFVVYMCCFIFAMLPSFFSIFLLERDWNILKYFFYLIPPSCLSIVLSTVSQFGVTDLTWTWGELIAPITFLFLDALLYTPILFLIDLSMQQKSPRHSKACEAPDEDPFVAAERRSIIRAYGFGTEFNESRWAEEECSAGSHPTASHQRTLAVQGLRKEFTTRKKCTRSQVVAVKDLWISADVGECLGFLGLNGAGKSTSIQMLTGGLRPSRGTAVVAGKKLSDITWRDYGLCPQFDTLIERLTGREHLMLTGQVAGIPLDKLEDFAREALAALTISEYADTMVGAFSGGTKRKLSLGTAFIGDPSVVFLDEPSSGVDPASRRALWNVIEQCTRTRAIMLTTHSLEECEALSHKVGIMKAGELVRLGSPTALKSRYGRVWVVEVTVAPSENLTEVTTTMKKLLPDMHATETFGSTIRADVPKDSMKAAEVITNAESLKDYYLVEHISISDVSLETIFLKLNANEEGIDMDDSFLSQKSLKSDSKDLMSNSEPKSLGDSFLSQKSLKSDSKDLKSEWDSSSSSHSES